MQLRALIIAVCFAAFTATSVAVAQTPEAPAAPAAAAQEPSPHAVVAPGFDLAAAENGGRVEWVSSQYSTSGPAMNLIATTRHAGWIGTQTPPHEIVFSFFNRQSALVASVLINPMTRNNNDRPQDVEIWVSDESPTEGFTRVAAATLVAEDSLQPVEFAPVDARFVKLRILSTYAPVPGANPGGFAVGASRVKIMEGERPGYTSILARNPELAALAAGSIPVAPPEAARPTPPAGGADACSPPGDEPPKPSTFPQSTQVLVVTDDANLYRAVVWKSANTDTYNQEGRAVVPGVGFTWVTPGVAAPVHLIAEPRVDTVIFAQACGINEDVSSAFKQALLAWVAAGHKLIIQDSDYCAGSSTPKYDFIPYPFATLNPGASGAKGEAGVFENSTLASSNPADAAFIDTDAWKSGSNDLGDSNIIVQYDARWCGAMWARNKLQKNGFALAYAHYGRGLVIYDGFDMDQGANPVYQRLVTRELLQPFDSDHLPCTQPLGGFIITTDSELKTQAMAAGKTYTYPVEVLGNFGYAGRVTLEATVIPADPAVSVALDTPLADLTEVDEATTSLTVTAGEGASLSSKVIAVRGLDTEGKSNVLCLNLPERRSGSVQLLSGLRQDRKPPKNIEIILDASGSMKAMLGAKSRWAVAQDVLKEVVAKLPAEFSVGLRAYGHTLSSKDPNTCTDTALVVPVAPLNPDQLLAAAAKLAPRGETPLVHSILQTPGDLQASGGGTVILITDGEESCKGDFAAAEATLKESGINLVLNIVGFTLDNAPAEALLTGLAESTGGNYYGAASGEELARALLLAAVDRLPYRILDATGAEVAQGEAGVGGAHELPAGDYTVVVTAADREVRTPVTIEVGKDIALKALIKDDQLVVEESEDVAGPTTGMTAPEAGASGDPVGTSQPELTGTEETAGAPQPEQGATAQAADTSQIEATATTNAAETAPPGAAAAADQAYTPTPADAPQQRVDSVNTAPSISIAEAVRNVNSILDEIAAEDRKLPHREFDPAALATALGTDPKTQYEWVRNNTSWVPYAGLLRGARGVLLDRVGGSVDRAVLLGDLLRRSGHQVRLAHASLSQRQASDLLAGMEVSRPQSRTANVPDENSALIVSEARALVEARVGPLLAVFGNGAAAQPNRDDSSAIEAIQDHWWVEYWADGKWVVLDLLAPAADVGNTLVAASDSHAWEPASEVPPVPEEEWHSVRLRVVVERYDGAATTESTVLEHVLRPAEILGMRIALTHYPTPWPEEFPFSSSQPNALSDAAVQVRQWVPMLLIGDRVVSQSGIGDDGNTIADPSSSLNPVAQTSGSGLMGAFDDALGGGEAAESFMTAEWLDLELHIPGSASGTIRRPLFDVLGPEKRAAKVSGFDAGTNDLLVKRYQALVGVYSILIQPCAFTEDYIAHLAMNTFLETRGDVQRLAVEKDPKVLQGIASTIVARMEAGHPLWRLAHMRSMLSRETADWFIDQPNVLILGEGLPVVNADKAALVEFMDIASNAVGVRPDSELNAFQVRLRQGVVDTIAEQVSLSGTLDKGENAATTFPLDDADAWRLIGPRDLTAAGELDWPGDVVARLREDIEAGYAAYVPTRAFENGGRARWGWWRVDPLSGETVGVMDTGLHMATVEKKVVDMTPEEKHAYYWGNKTKWKAVKDTKGSYGYVSPKDQQLANNMFQIWKEFKAAGLPV